MSSSVVFGKEPNHYWLLDEIGQGGQATAYLCRKVSAGVQGPLYIAKIFKLPKYPELQDANDPTPEAEAKRLQMYDHPNIVKCFDAFRHDFPQPQGPSYVIVMEYCDGKLIILIR